MTNFKVNYSFNDQEYFIQHDKKLALCAVVAL